MSPVRTTESSGRFLIHDDKSKTVSLTHFTFLYNAVFFVGGFGATYDFPDNLDVQRLIRDVYIVLEI